MGGALFVGGAIDQGLDWYLDPDPYKLPKSAGFNICCGPQLPYLEYKYAKGWTSHGHCDACGLLGQAITGTALWDQVTHISADILQIGLLSRVNPPGLGGGFRIHKVWTRPSPGVANQPWARMPTIPLNPLPDPNVLRWRPSPGPWAPGAPEQPLAPEPEPSGPPEPASPLAPSPWRPWNYSTTPQGQPLPRNSPSRPPPGNVKERKFMTKAAQFGVWLYRALDWISESAEAFDAVYDALPDDVKDRWEAGRDLDRPFDAFGQYGAEGVDWKVQALWHNWHRLDVNQALENILRNYVEDRVIGSYQRRLPRGVGGGLGTIGPDDEGDATNISPEMLVAMRVDEALDWLFSQFQQEEAQSRAG